jgi:hypothetical protein
MTAWYDPHRWTWTEAAALLVALMAIVVLGSFTDAIQAAPDLVRYAFIAGAILFVVPSNAMYGVWGRALLILRLALIFGSVAWAVAYALRLTDA